MSNPSFSDHPLNSFPTASVVAPPVIKTNVPIVAPFITTLAAATPIFAKNPPVIKIPIIMVVNPKTVSISSSPFKYPCDSVEAIIIAGCGATNCFCNKSITASPI